jgi:hypothetical protein
MNPHEAEQMALRLIAFLETGDADPELFCADAFCDFTTPRWRVQAQGAEALVQLRRRGHPSPGRVPRWRCDATASGFVLEVEETWQQDGEAWYCRELFRADVRERAIEQLSVYCTGDWDSARRAQHAREVRLLRP